MSPHGAIRLSQIGRAPDVLLSSRRLLRFEQASWGNAQRFGDPTKRAHGRISRAAFEVAEIAALHPGPESQFFLRQSLTIPKRPHVLPEENDDVHTDRWPRLGSGRRPPIVSFRIC